MSHLAIFTQSPEVIAVGDNDLVYPLVQFTPRSPQLNQDGEPDLSQNIPEVMSVYINGATADQAIEKLNAIERMLNNAIRYQRDPHYCAITTLTWRPEGASNSVTAEVLGGWVEKPARLMERQDTRQSFINQAVIHFTRRPVWQAPEAIASLTTSPTDNGANNFGALPLIPGDLPARARLRVTMSGGNSASCQRLLASLRHNSTPANFQHLLKVANMPAGWAITAGTDTVISADANFLSASKARYTPNMARSSENMMVRWVYSGANILDQLGRFLPVVRYRDNFTAANFRLRMRSGISTSQYGAYSIPYPLTTLFADSAGTTEIGSMDLGQLAVPGAGWDVQVPGSLIYELMVTPVTIAGTLDVDYIGLHPLGEAGEGYGLALGEFPAAIAANRAYLDARLGYDRAYLASGADVKLTSYADYPDGAEVRLPTRKAGMRIYLAAARNRDNYAKHNAATVLGMVVTYVSQYVHMRGTT